MENNSKWYSTDLVSTSIGKLVSNMLAVFKIILCVYSFYTNVFAWDPLDNVQKPDNLISFFGPWQPKISNYFPFQSKASSFACQLDKQTF